MENPDKDELLEFCNSENYQMLSPQQRAECSMVYSDGSSIQYEEMEKIAQQKRNSELFRSLPYDVFANLIIEGGDIKGRDLIAMCISDPVINEKCNNRDGEIFRQLLLRDHQLEVPQNITVNQLRDLYMKYSYGQVYRYGPKRSGPKNKNPENYLRRLELNFEAVDISYNEDALYVITKNGDVYTNKDVYFKARRFTPKNILEFDSKIGLYKFVNIKNAKQVLTAENNIFVLTKSGLVYALGDYPYISFEEKPSTFSQIPDIDRVIQIALDKKRIYFLRYNGKVYSKLIGDRKVDNPSVVKENLRNITSLVSNTKSNSISKNVIFAINGDGDLFYRKLGQDTFEIDPMFKNVDKVVVDNQIKIVINSDGEAFTSDKFSAPGSYVEKIEFPEKIKYVDMSFHRTVIVTQKGEVYVRFVQKSVPDKFEDYTKIEEIRNAVKAVITNNFASVHILT